MAEPTKTYGIVVVQTTRTEYDVPAWSAEQAKQLMEDYAKNSMGGIPLELQKEGAEVIEPPKGMVVVGKTVERTVVKRATPKKDTEEKTEA
ncbi:MAG: hypothetical protein PHN89_05760 [Candidatus Pacebacteria bacterium]|nr:hypothetical protein [Candidatus Paceibacterota bacterium]